MSAGQDRAAAATIAAVRARMQQIGAQLPAGDGVGRFNHLYLSVTEDVAGVVGAEFEDPAFLAELDVAFAALYFAAVDAAAGRRRVTHAWAPLFAARRRHGIAPIQFALAGMNAHINRDLAVALAATAHRRGLTLADDTPQHRDYERVNKVLQAVEKRIKAEYATGLIGVSDHVLGRLDDVVAMWCVTAARDAAWTHAKTLAALEGHHLLRTRFVDTLDQMVGFAGRGLLVPLLDV